MTAIVVKGGVAVAYVLVRIIFCDDIKLQTIFLASTGIIIRHSCLIKIGFPYYTCRDDQFRCLSGNCKRRSDYCNRSSPCIPVSWRKCGRGTKDCEDGSDEQACGK